MNWYIVNPDELQFEVEIGDWTLSVLKVRTGYTWELYKCDSETKIMGRKIIGNREEAMNRAECAYQYYANVKGC